MSSNAAEVPALSQEGSPTVQMAGSSTRLSIGEAVSSYENGGAAAAAEAAAASASSGPGNTTGSAPPSSGGRVNSYFKLDAAEWLKVIDYAHRNRMMHEPSKLFAALDLIGIAAPKNSKAFAAQWKDRREELVNFARAFFEQKEKDPHLGNTDELNMPAIAATRELVQYMTRWSPNPELALRAGLYLCTKKAQAIAKVVKDNSDEVIKVDGSKYLDIGPAGMSGTFTRKDKKVLDDNLARDEEFHKGLRSKSQDAVCSAASAEDRMKMAKTIEFARAKKRMKPSDLSSEGDESTPISSSSSLGRSSSVYNQDTVQERLAKIAAMKKEDLKELVSAISDRVCDVLKEFNAALSETLRENNRQLLEMLRIIEPRSTSKKA